MYDNCQNLEDRVVLCSVLFIALFLPILWPQIGNIKFIINFQVGVGTYVL